MNLEVCDTPLKVGQHVLQLVLLGTPPALKEVGSKGFSHLSDAEMSQLSWMPGFFWSVAASLRL